MWSSWRESPFWSITAPTLPRMARLRGQVPPSFSFYITNVIIIIIIVFENTSCTSVKRCDSGSSLKKWMNALFLWFDRNWRLQPKMENGEIIACKPAPPHFPCWWRTQSHPGLIFTMVEVLVVAVLVVMATNLNKDLCSEVSIGWGEGKFLQQTQATCCHVKAVHLCVDHNYSAVGNPNGFWGTKWCWFCFDLHPALEFTDKEGKGELWVEDKVPRSSSGGCIVLRLSTFFFLVSI